MLTDTIYRTPSLAKPWGETKRIHRDTTHEIWHASIKAGGFSSWHTHARKPNLFYVLSGTMRVLASGEHHPQSGAKVTGYVLGVGEQIVIDDGVWHRFEAVTDVELIEVYWACLKGEDINRADQGGMKQ